MPTAPFIQACSSSSTTRASSGKGRLALCRYIVEPIHDRLREINETEVMEYKQKLAEYNAAGKKKASMEKPEEPPMRMLFIPANSSATAVYQVLGDNGGAGLMFETEGDTLANTFGSDYGNYSDGFRKAFHHETISYIRRKDREYVNIKNSRLSTLLTGTPRQVLNLITDAEVILRHNAHIFLSLPKAEILLTASSASSTRTTLQQRQFLETLPSEFDRQTYTELATTLGINPRTADRIIRRRCDSGQLENIAHGKYRKK